VTYDPDYEEWQMPCGAAVYGEDAIADHEYACERGCGEGAEP
jgi:hypothetical protein